MKSLLNFDKILSQVQHKKVIQSIYLKVVRGNIFNQGHAEIVICIEFLSLLTVMFDLPIPNNQTLIN